MAIKIIKESRANPQAPTIGADVSMAFFYSWVAGVISGTALYNKPRAKVYIDTNPKGRPIHPPINMELPTTMLREHYGTAISFSQKKGKSVAMNVATPEQAYSELERRRAKSVNLIGRVLRYDHDDILQIVVGMEDGGGKRRPVDAATLPRLKADIASGHAKNSLLQSTCANLALANQLQVWIASHYQLPVIGERGWLTGRMVERDTMLTKVPAPEKWNKDARKLFDALHVAPPSDNEGFAIPTPGALDLNPTSPPGKPKKGDRDPWRLLFYMALGSYRELRYLRGKLNKYGYMGIVLNRAESCPTDRTIIDTEREGNAIRLLSGGPLSELLEIATGTKQEIDESEHSEWLRHDPQNRWQSRIKEFAA